MKKVLSIMLIVLIAVAVMLTVTDVPSLIKHADA